MANGLLGLVSAQYNRLHRTTVNTDNNKFKRFCLVGLSLCNPINGMFLLLLIKNNNNNKKSTDYYNQAKYALHVRGEY